VFDLVRFACLVGWFCRLVFLLDLIALHIPPGHGEEVQDP
jgi:hypothetical protein